MNHALNHDDVVSDVGGDTGMTQLNFLRFNLQSSTLDLEFFSLLDIRIVKWNDAVRCDEISSGRH